MQYNDDWKTETNVPQKPDLSYMMLTFSQFFLKMYDVQSNKQELLQLVTVYLELLTI